MNVRVESFSGGECDISAVMCVTCSGHGTEALGSRYNSQNQERVRSRILNANYDEMVKTWQKNI
jgi:hypothetical protein